ncbi:MAG: hypothetical protein RLZZ330_232 [Actinomycetota bacterium]|jgi:abortive infection bacteriophage resistance protein
MKPFLSLNEQIALLSNRGLEIHHENDFREYLRQNNYYRLRGYFHPFLLENNQSQTSQFKPGSSSKLLIEITQFDRELRELLFQALSVLETQFKSFIAYRIGSHNEYLHLDGSGLTYEFLNVPTENGKTRFQNWSEKYEKTMQKRMHSEIVKSHVTKYNGKLPIWAAVEILDFGQVSSLYRGLDESIAALVANEFDCKVSFLRTSIATLNDLRNHVAHQSRIWNFHYPVIPTFRKSSLPVELANLRMLDDYDKHKLYLRLELLIWFDSRNSFSIEFSNKLKDVLSRFPKSIFLDKHGFGLPRSFQTSALWKNIDS